MSIYKRIPVIVVVAILMLVAAACSVQRAACSVQRAAPTTATAEPEDEATTAEPTEAPEPEPEPELVWGDIGESFVGNVTDAYPAGPAVEDEVKVYFNNGTDGTLVAIYHGPGLSDPAGLCLGNSLNDGSAFALYRMLRLRQVPVTASRARLARFACAPATSGCTTRRSRTIQRVRCSDHSSVWSMASSTAKPQSLRTVPAHRRSTTQPMRTRSRRCSRSTLPQRSSARTR
jgi:hypothetical protein